MTTDAEWDAAQVCPANTDPESKGFEMGSHCDCWWDGAEPCCWCGSNEPTPEDCE